MPERTPGVLGCVVALLPIGGAYLVYRVAEQYGLLGCPATWGLMLVCIGLAVLIIRSASHAWKQADPRR